MTTSLIHRHKSNNILIRMNEVRVSNSEMSIRNNESWLNYTRNIGPEIAQLNTD